LFAVACAQVDRGYDPVSSGGSAATGAEAGDIGEAGQASGGKAGHGGSGGAAGHAGHGMAGSGEGGEAGTPGTLPDTALSVALDGTGRGVVASDVGGIDCGTECMASFPEGTQVTLTAMPATGSVFAGWAGAGCTGTDPTCVVKVGGGSTLTATATFNREIPILTVTPAGSGTGSVTSDLPGINCGATCSARYDYGASVTLTATPDTGSAFKGWSGACTGTAACTVPVNGTTQVTATFDIIIPHITITNAGSGTGTVTSAPAGITCGSVCTSAFTYGASVTLTATPTAGMAFTGWSGDGSCTGTAPCTISAKGESAVTATFDIIPKITVTKTGTGLGTVTSAPAGISCGTTCTGAFTYGTSVVLTAAAGAGSAFTGWTGGGCSGVGTCTISATADTPVSATFACTGSTTFNYSGTMTTFTVPGCVTQLTIDAFGAQGGSGFNSSSAAVYPGGFGARIKGTFAVTGGTVYKVLVGGAGVAYAITPNAPDSQAGGTGGGGTFVTTSTNSPIVVAGGGGGGGGWPGNAGAGVGGVTSNAGSAAAGGQDLGGTAGAGGAACPVTGYHGGAGGGGLTGNGGSTTGSATSYGTPLGGGIAFISGGSGGAANSCVGTTGTMCAVGRAGGFGGGGAAGYTGGGGGGYSGGGAGDYPNSTVGGGGGGGGSYILPGATAQLLIAASRSGNGLLTFSW
jgi:hypothetical protein